MAKHTLNVEYDFDFMLFAITAHEIDYKFCHKLNTHLFLDLQKEEALELKNKNQSEQLLFSLYSFINDEDVEYNLIGNKSFNQVQSNKTISSAQQDLFSDAPETTGQIGYLIPELSTYDYLLIIRTSYSPVLAYNTETQLKELEPVLKVQYIDVNDLSSKNNLIF